MTTYRKIVVGLAALAMLASACGDDGGGETASADDPLVRAIVDDVIADGGGVTTDRAEAECFVGGVVGEIGTERLNALGVTETEVAALDEIEWTEAEARSVVDSMFGCIDVTASFVDQMQLADLDETQSECVSEAFTDDVMKDFMVAFLTADDGGQEALATLLGGIAECGVDPSGG